MNIKGKVITNKMKNTVIVAVPYVVRHKKYGKILKKTTKLAAHVESAVPVVGEEVVLVQTKPYSKTVYFKVVEKKS